MRVLGTILASSLLAASAVSQAGDFYLGGGIGTSRSDLNASTIDDAFADAGFASSTSIDDNSTSYQFFGGYQAHQYLAIEAGWLNLGDIDSSSTLAAPNAGNSNTTVDIDGFKLGVVVGKEVMQNVKVFANLGMFIWDADYSSNATINGVSSQINSNDDGSDVYFGLGAAYQINTNFSVRADWNRYTLGGDTDIDVDVYGISALYHF